MRVAILKRFAFGFMVVLLFGQLVGQNVYARPLDTEEIKALDEYTQWVGNCGATPDGAATADSTSTASGPVYIMGDSITAMAKPTYLKKFKKMSPTVEGLGSRHIYQNSPSPSGINQVKQDKDKIGAARAIVIALGTNDLINPPSSTETQVKGLMTELKKANSNSAPVYWVNVIDTRNDNDSKKTNNAIKNGLGSEGKIIDWYTAAKDKAKLSTFEGGVHPTKQPDFDLLVNLVYDTVTGDSATGNTSVSQQVKKNYISAGNIPESGKTIGATYYGGRYINGKWEPSNDIQGGVRPHDDNGVNSYNGKPIAGHTAFAELGSGTLLGSLPYQKDGKPNTKLEITYKGKSIIAEKVDIGTGQAGNSHYRLDLWWETAKLLGVTDNVDIKVHVVPSDTPVTPLDGSPTDSNAQDSSAGQNQACQCGTSGDASAADSMSASNPGEGFVVEKNFEVIFDFFVNNGYKPFQAAGIVGNIARESGGEPKRFEGHFNETFDFPPETQSQHSGYGLVGWTPSQKIVDYAKSVNKPVGDMSTQLEFLLKQLEGKAGQWSVKAAGDALKKTTSVKDATETFMNEFERPNKQKGLESLPLRIAAAQNTLKKYGNNVQGSDSSGGGACQCDTENAANPSDSNKIADKLKELGKEAKDKTAISVMSVDGSIKADYNGDDVMNTRSSYKVYTAYATLKAIEDGKISWSSSVNTPKWHGSVESTMKAMIINSTNEAAEALRTDSRIGSHAYVTKLLQNQVGLSDKTVMGSNSYLSPTGTNTKSTANDFSKFLTLLYKKKLPGVDKDSNYDKLISLMKKATTNGSSARDGIAKGVGGSTEVADKPGWGSVGAAPASNDVGIVYLKDKPYVVSILTTTPNQWDNVAKIAGEVNKLMGGVSGGGGDCATGGDASALQQTVKKYAWPQFHSSPYTDAKPAYKDAITRAKSKGQYIGGHNGIDCGAFVTRAMIDSGFEPRYNWSGKGGRTGMTVNEDKSQWKWLDENWKKINPTSTADLQPGDVAINAIHTYLYVGRMDGFDSVYASASLGERAPMADYHTTIDTDFTWYRKQ